MKRTQPCPRGIAWVAIAATIGAALIAPVAADGTLLLAGGGYEGDLGDTQAWGYRALGRLLDDACAPAIAGGRACQVRVPDVEPNTACGAVPDGLCAYFEWIGAERGFDVDATPLDIRRTCPLLGAPDCREADDPQLVAQLDGVDAFWFRGGDQALYRDAWAGTAFEQAVVDRFRAGAGIGGTSAGAMILSGTSSFGDAPSYEALADPFHPGIDLSDALFGGPTALLPETLIDTHFTERARLGRLATFLARTLSESGGAATPLAIGIDGETALAVGADGIAETIGEGVVAFLQLDDTTRSAAIAGSPPFVTALRLRQYTEGARFDLPGSRTVMLPASMAPAPLPQDEAAPLATLLDGATESDRTQGTAWADWSAAPSPSAALDQGDLQLRSGSGVADTMVVAPLVEDSTALRENRFGGALWALHMAEPHGIAILLDGFDGAAFTRVEVRADGTLEVVAPPSTPEESAVLVDCMGVGAAGISTADGDGNGRPRQSVGLHECRVHLLNSRVGESTYRLDAHGTPLQPIGPVPRIRLRTEVDGTALTGDFGVPGASHYQWVRGTLDALGTAGETVVLGTVTCVADHVTPIEMASGARRDADLPAPGAGFFYLARGARDLDIRGSLDGLGADRQETPPGDCP